MQNNAHPLSDLKAVNDSLPLLTATEPAAGFFLFRAEPWKAKEGLDRLILHFYLVLWSSTGLGERPPHTLVEPSGTLEGLMRNPHSLAGPSGALHGLVRDLTPLPSP